jgi:hypothetical protein
MGSVASGPHRCDFLLTVTKPPTETGDLFQSEVVEQEAQYGALKATQEAGQMTRNLTLTLGTVDAVQLQPRATQPRRRTLPCATTPNRSVLSRRLSKSTRSTSRLDEAQAAYLRQASSQAPLVGELGAAGSVAQGVGGALPGIAKLF